jgi:hypothetical protein
MPFALRLESATHVIDRLRQSYRHFIGDLRRRSKKEPKPPASTRVVSVTCVRIPRKCNTLQTTLDILYENNGCISN